MTDTPRLIEVAFPLRQTSIDSVHEKNVRHGHISTLHIWPARRPLAAARAALIATLLPDPGDDDKRREILERLGGRLKKVQKRKVLPGGRVEFTEAEETEGGILHWGRESGPDLDWFREEIRKAYGGRAPRVLDPFAGGGAIPLEAMRLGCEVTAGDINPVAWFILKCTLEYPQRLAGQTRPLPAFALKDAEFMEAFLKARGATGKKLQRELAHYGLGEDTANYFAGWDPDEPAPEADLAWHVRAWGRWVLEHAKADLAPYYPTIDGKPTVAYLWARTVKCKSCRATIPLLKTRWLCKKDNKRVLLTMAPNADRTGVVFGVQTDVPVVGTNAAQRREHDRRLGGGTMSRTGASCPLCPALMTMEDIRHEGMAGRLGTQMTAVVVDGTRGKEYRVPADAEREAAEGAGEAVPGVFEKVPFGVPDEPTPKGGIGAARAFSVDGYGFDRWHKLFTPRQLLALGTFVVHTRAARQAMKEAGYPGEWVEAVSSYLAAAIDRVANRGSVLCIWNMGAEKVEQTFARFALPILWDFPEANSLADASGSYLGETEWLALVASHLLAATSNFPPPKVVGVSATHSCGELFDAVVTDPPYYDAIPYSDLMDFFYIWLRRTLSGISPEVDGAFREPLGPKWNSTERDGELIDDASRFGGDREQSRAAYEEGMYRSFVAVRGSLAEDGKLVVVFAHKHPDAWETLVGAIIRAGFVVDASWPIQTERTGRMRATTGAALSSSVWLVCKKRPEAARPGWDNAVLEEMRERITTRLRRFWDDGIRGPDFVWAATGPALEAYSKHPIVKKANDPGKLLEVHEFLQHVRRMVVDFVVGRVLSGGEGGEETTGLDDVTTYYLLHRNDFQLADAPAGPCILYALSCNLSDKALADDYDILARTGGREPSDEDDEVEGEDAEGEAEQGTGSRVRLKAWSQRRRRTMGYEGAGGRPAPLIDQVHRLMHLWKAGDVTEVDDYLDEHGLRSSALFRHLVQALIELASHDRDREERSILESISNHLQARGVPVAARPPKPVQATLGLE
jgi:adenine-specific DNA methylase